MTFSIQATEQQVQVVSPQAYRRSLPRKRPTASGPALSGVGGTHAARSLHATRVDWLEGGGKVALTERPPHTRWGSHTPIPWVVPGGLLPFFAGRIQLNRDGSSRVRKTPLAACSRWIVPGSLVDITRVDVSSRVAGARLPN